MKKTVADPETNMGSTSEKCPRTSQLMLDEGNPLQNQNAENEYLRKLLDLGDFQQTNSEGFSNGFDAKQRVTKRKGPQYRRINTYFKSTKQYWKERDRRKQAWELSGKHTYKQIAEKLGVSEKTVQRDIKKIRPYFYRLSRKYFRELEAERDRQLQAELEGKNVFQQFKILSRRLAEYQKLMQFRQYLRHSMFVTFDLDRNLSLACYSFDSVLDYAVDSNGNLPLNGIDRRQFRLIFNLNASRGH